MAHVTAPADLAGQLNQGRLKMSYAKEHMKNSLAEHELHRESESVFVMRRPNSGMYSLWIAEVARRIVLVGDLTIGTQNGCVSAAGYDIEWFCKPLSEGYLCSKFLQKKWQWEAAAEELRNWIEKPEEFLDTESTLFNGKTHAEYISEIVDADKSESRMRSVDFYWPYGAPSERDLHEALADLDSCYVSDGVPGYDWPRADAGWLVAAHDRFVDLYATTGGAVMPQVG